MPAGTAGAAYSQTLTSGGTAPFTWSVTGGALPSGTTLAASTGALSGAPSAAGTFTFTVQAANSAGTNSKQLSLTINPATAPPPPATSGQWSLGYWTQWGSPVIPVSAIDFKALTHVVQYAAIINADGSLDVNTYAVAANAKSLVSTAHAAGAKVLLGLIQPYGSTATGNFYQAATNNGATLINNIVSVLNTYGFDGVDANFQPFNTSSTGVAMTTFAPALKAQLGGKLLVVDTSITDYNYWTGLQSSIDKMNVMTYNMSGSWDPYSWHNSALYDSDGKVWSVNLAVTRYMNAGIPASKINIGIPFFGVQDTGGHLSTNFNQGITGPKQTWSSAPAQTQYSYQQIAGMINSSNSKWDSVAQVPYLSVNNPGYANDSFLSYDNAVSVAAKVNYAKSKGLGGWAIWDISSDYFPGQNPTNPLLTAVKNAR
jgi:chitinase